MSLMNMFSPDDHEEQLQVVKNNNKVEFQTKVGQVILSITLAQYRELRLSSIYIKGLPLTLN